MEAHTRWIAMLGLVVVTGIGYLFSVNKKKVDWRLVGVAISLQALIALAVIGIPALGIHAPLRFFFEAANDAVNAFLGYTEQGSRFLFGDLLDTKKIGFIFAFQVLPTIIFISSLMSGLYYIGAMQWVVKWIAVGMQKTLRTSGAESLSMAANIFVGQTEAPLVVKPYVATMTRSELFCVMVGGMATVAGGVLAAYVGLLKDRIPDIAGHLLTASFISAPAAFLFSKLIYPEDDKPKTMGKIPREAEENPATNLVDSLALGAGDGLKLAVNVGGMLLAFIALIAMCDGMFKVIGEWIQFDVWGTAMVPATMLKNGHAELSLGLIFGWVFSPFAYLIGIPWSEAMSAGMLLGQKVILNEFVAYLNMSSMGSQLSDRTVVILSYALCGFANFSSIAIQIGGIGGIAPSRRPDLADLGVLSVVAGTLSGLMTATFAAILI